MNNKILVLGSTGMLGYKVLNVLRAQYGTSNVTASLRNFDNVKNVENTIQFNALANNIQFKEHYDYIINCIGIIKPLVEKAGCVETIMINSIFPRKLSRYCEEEGSRLIHITTDCVYSGKKGNYTENDLHDAEDVYGKSKSLGEPENCMVLRTSIIGEELYNNISLIEWAKSQRGKEVKGFLDWWWSGITTTQYTKCLLKIIDNDWYKPELFHIFSPCDVSKYDLLQLINRKFNLDLVIKPFKTGKPIYRTLRTAKELYGKLEIPGLWEQMLEM